MATKHEVIALDEERKSRRARLADKFDTAKEKLAPSTLASRISDEQKQKISNTGKRVGTFTKDHKYSIGGAVAAVAAAGAGLFLWSRSKKTGLEGESTIDTAPTDGEVETALTEAEPIVGGQPSAAAGSAV